MRNSVMRQGISPLRGPLILLILLLGTAVALPGNALRAQPAMPELPRFFGNFVPRPGAWSEYAVTEKKSGRTSKTKLAIVGREGDDYWYEVHNSTGAGLSIIKMLVSGDPKDADNIRRLIIKSGGGPAMEMPRDFVVMGRKMASHMFESRSGVSARPEEGTTVEELGDGEVTVPAGTFAVKKRRIVGGAGEMRGTYSFSPDILPIGVVVSDTEEATMELTAHGTDARSAVTEEPVPMPGPPPGMGGGPGGGVSPTR